MKILLHMNTQFLKNCSVMNLQWQYQKHWHAHRNILSSEAFKVNSSCEIWGFMQYCVWALGFSETWHRVTGWELPTILKTCSAFIFTCHGTFFMALLTLEDEGTTFLQDVRKHSPIDTALYTRETWMFILNFFYALLLHSVSELFKWA